MGRKGRTGSGGAVVSSLSVKGGGVTKTKDDVAGQAGPSESAGWIGKTPQDLLRDACNRAGRKRAAFSETARDGIFKCVIPAGKREIKKASDQTDPPAIVVFGNFPGEAWAALAALHVLEHDRNLEIVMAPEYRDEWKAMGVRLKEKKAGEEVRKAKVEERKQREEQSKKLKARNTNIELSSESRLLVEAALSNKMVPTPLADRPMPRANIETLDILNNEESERITRRLVLDGFDLLDVELALHCVSRVDYNILLEWLLLNLSEEQLPKAFAAKADIEVMRASEEKKIHFKVEATNRLCASYGISRSAAQKALLLSNQNEHSAAARIFRTLSGLPLPIVPGEALPDFETTQSASDMKTGENEAIDAIYEGSKEVRVKSGHGCGMFPDAWACEISFSKLACLKNKPLTVVIQDHDSLYPYTLPTCFIRDSADIRPAQMRALLRALAGEMAKLRNCGWLKSQEELHREFEANRQTVEGDPIPVVFHLISFLEQCTVDSLKEASKALFVYHYSVALVNQMTSRGSSGGIKTVPQKAEYNGPAEPVSKKKAFVVGSKASHPPKRKACKPVSERDPAIMKRRRDLPAWKYRNPLVETVSKYQVTLVCASTGSGKTTQVPQFLLDHEEDGSSLVRLDVSNVVCTQPRRLAAISVAERVAFERGEKIGDSVGYQVKLNTKKSENTCLTFVTTGVLLRKLALEPDLDSISVLIIDEVHERSVETDVLLAIVRRICQRRPTLRVVLMSATVVAEKFAAYFQSASVPVSIIQMEGRAYPVDVVYLDSVVPTVGYYLKPGDKYTSKKRKKPAADLYDESEDWNDRNEEDPKKAKDKLSSAASASASTSLRLERGVQHLSVDDLNTLEIIDEYCVNVDLIEQLVLYISKIKATSMDQAILVFLPGVPDIMLLKSRLEKYGFLWVLELHASLSAENQAKVFSKPPNATQRKVVLSTNVAETSITVDDVVFVIDSMRVKQLEHDVANDASVLVETTISKANAGQRSGRAGRTQPGIAYRLVKQKTFEQVLPNDLLPELCRVSLDRVILTALSANFPDVLEFLASTLDPPPLASVETSIEALICIGAIEREEASKGSKTHFKLTSLGRHLTGLPLDPRLGKLIIYSSIFGCLEPCLIIASILSDKSPFVHSYEKRDAARQAKRKFLWKKSDFLMYVKMYKTWRAFQQTHSVSEQYKFCEENFLSRRTLLSIEDTRKQLLGILLDAGFGGPNPNAKPKAKAMDDDDESMLNQIDLNKNSENAKLIEGILSAAFYPNVVRVEPKTKFQQTAHGVVEAQATSGAQLILRDAQRNRVFIHADSVTFDETQFETEWLVFHEKFLSGVKKQVSEVNKPDKPVAPTTATAGSFPAAKIYIRNVTMVSPLAVLLFGGSISVQASRGVLAMDNMYFNGAPRVAILISTLRNELDNLLQYLIQNPGAQGDSQHLQTAVISLLSN